MDDVLRQFSGNAPAAEQAVDATERTLGRRLPDDFRAFLQVAVGGGEAYALDYRRNSAPAVVRIPFVGIACDDAVRVARDFTGFLEQSGNCEACKGGDPVDPANKILLTQQQHIEAVRYWNPDDRSATGRRGRSKHSRGADAVRQAHPSAVYREPSR